MTASSKQKAPYRRSSKMDRLGETLPTLFQIPMLCSGAMEDRLEETDEASSDIPDSREPATVKKETFSTISETRLDSGRPDEVVRPPESIRPDPPPAYKDLASLPPLDEPVGRSWAEAVGSRLVLVLLFAAIATVAVLGTRDVPESPSESRLVVDSGSSSNPEDALPGGREMRLAQSQHDSVADPGHSQVAASPTLANDTQSDLIDVPYQAMSLDTNSGSTDVASTSNDVADSGSSQTGSSQPYGELSQVPPLPAFLETGDDPARPDNANVVSANTSARTDVTTPGSNAPVNDNGNAPVNDGSLSQSPQPAVAVTTTETTKDDRRSDSPTLGMGHPENANSLDLVENSTSTATLDLPVYKSTSTPDPITDWSRYYPQSQTVGFQSSPSPQAASQQQPLSTQGYGQQGLQSPTQSAPPMTAGAPPSQPVPGNSAPLIHSPMVNQNQPQPGQQQGLNLQPPGGAASYQPQAAYPGVGGTPPYVQTPVYGQPAVPGYYPAAGQNRFPNAPAGYPSAVISANTGQPITQPR